MSLPNGFKNSCEYFHHANEFLKQNSWIYRAANTEFVKAGILNEMPQEFQDYFVKIETDELNKFPYVHKPLAQLNVKSIIDLRRNLAKLIPLETYKEPKEHVQASPKMEYFKKMSIKKQHEIQRLASVVQQTLEGKQNTVDSVMRQPKYVLIDFGSGLGYLSEFLYKLNKNFLILGLEADTYRVDAAEKRTKTYMPNATNSIQYRQEFITENSKAVIVKTVQEAFKLNYEHVPEQTTANMAKMAIIGLHACADLTITSMKLFLQLPQVQNLIIMPCCYHKLQVHDEAVAAATTAATAHLKFKNFPISKSLKEVLSGNNYNNHTTDKANNAVINEVFTTYLNRPFLRLACQQTLKRWAKCSTLEHKAHGSEMFLRAVAEALKLEEEEMDLVVVKRKKEKIDLNSFTGEQLNSFETFSHVYALKRKTDNEIVEWSEKHRNKFAEIIERHPNGGKLAEGLTCLQTSMQKLCENVVLYDRLCFLKETALNMNLKLKARYEKIMDEELSPRCYALIAEKI